MCIRDSDNLTLTGSLTATDATLTFDTVDADVDGDLTGNVTSSGISTFSDYVKIKSLNITNSTDNTTSPFYDSNAQSNAIGFANTEASSFLSNTGIGTQELHGNKLALEGSLAIYDENPTIAIGSTSIINLADNSDSGNVQMHNTDVVILGGSINLLPSNFTDTSGEVTFSATYTTVTDDNDTPDNTDDDVDYGVLENISSSDMAKLKVGMYIIMNDETYSTTVKLNTRITEIIDESSVQLSQEFATIDSTESLIFKGNMPSGTIGIGTTASTAIADFSGFTPGHSVGGLKLPVVTDEQRKTIAAEVGVVIYIIDGSSPGPYICTDVNTSTGQITWTPLTLGTDLPPNTVNSNAGYYGQA